MEAHKKEGVVFSDLRGKHVKIFGKTPERIALPEDYPIKEVFYTVSHRNVIRGMHLQEGPPQEKLITVLTGSVLVNVVCLDPEDEAFGTAVITTVLTAPQDEVSSVPQVFVPAKHALGYRVLEDATRVLYLAGSDFNPSGDVGLDPFDEDLALVWGIPKEEAILSPRDLELPSFATYKEGLSL